MLAMVCGMHSIPTAASTYKKTTDPLFFQSLLNDFAILKLRQAVLCEKVLSENAG